MRIIRGASSFLQLPTWGQLTGMVCADFNRVALWIWKRLRHPAAARINQGLTPLESV